MPVHTVKGGYKFSKSGKLYRSKGVKRKHRNGPGQYMPANIREAGIIS